MVEQKTVSTQEKEKDKIEHGKSAIQTGGEPVHVADPQPESSA